MADTKHPINAPSSGVSCSPELYAELLRIRAMSSATYKPTGAIFSADWSTREHHHVEGRRGAAFVERGAR